MKLVQNPAYEGEDIYASDYIPEKDAVGNCMSTRLKTNGAVAIFYPGVARTFCHKLGAEGLYLAFTSVHEVMLHDEESVESENFENNSGRDNRRSNPGRGCAYQTYLSLRSEIRPDRNASGIVLQVSFWLVIFG